ncbi:hypothetical protein VNO80_17498 [Phaseolus coccineus]|uniref:Uncharacterized protein n=1 Tax=Phaseolus coccineus TaxID=3886 RepID=A0AAN9QXZ2_PHACN
MYKGKRCKQHCSSTYALYVCFMKSSRIFLLIPLGVGWSPWRGWLPAMTNSRLMGMAPLLVFSDKSL